MIIIGFTHFSVSFSGILIVSVTFSEIRVVHNICISIIQIFDPITCVPSPFKSPNSYPVDNTKHDNIYPVHK